jgi:hypothetical protein
MMVMSPRLGQPAGQQFRDMKQSAAAVAPDGYAPQLLHGGQILVTRPAEV